MMALTVIGLEVPDDLAALLADNGIIVAEATKGHAGPLEGCLPYPYRPTPVTHLTLKEGKP